MRTLIGGLVLVVLTLADAAGVQNSADKIVVNKSKRELLLFRGETVYRTYRVALGRNPIGPKQQEGDGKTPEGS